jgi:hypothetical protein
VTKQVCTDSIVLNVIHSSFRHAPLRAHLDSCSRKGSSGQTMSEFVSQHGEDAARIKIAVGRITPCSYCQPVLTVEVSA